MEPHLSYNIQQFSYHNFHPIIAQLDSNLPTPEESFFSGFSSRFVHEANHFLSVVAAVEPKVKTHAFPMEKNGLSGQGSSCCVCHWWIPSSLSPGSLEGFILPSNSANRKNLCEKVSCNICILVDLCFVCISETQRFRWQLSFPDLMISIRKVPCISLSSLCQKAAFLFLAASKSFPPPIMQYLLVTSLSTDCIPKACFRNTSILARPHLNTSVKNLS